MDQEERIEKLEEQVSDLKHYLDQALMILGDSDYLLMDAIYIENIRKEMQR